MDSPTDSAVPSSDPSCANIDRAVKKVLGEIAQLATDNGRSADAVTLLAVSKTRSAEEVAAAYDAGARHFGENYLQDALQKCAWVADQQRHDPQRFSALTWHFIGALQSNKTRDVARWFDWVHTLDRPKIARRLASARDDNAPPLQICVQVNLHNEPQKAGVAPEHLPELLAVVDELPQLNARGLMILPSTAVEPAAAFEALAQLFDRLQLKLGSDQTDLSQWDTLSMGMSGDYPAAIAAGSTMVRIGTALFGPRNT